MGLVFILLALAFGLKPQVEHSSQQLGLKGAVKEVRSCTRLQNSVSCMENEVTRFDSSGRITFSSSRSFQSDTLSEMNLRRVYSYEGCLLKTWSIYSAKGELLAVHEYFYENGELGLECIKDMRTGNVRGRKYAAIPDGYEESGFEVSGIDTVFLFPVKRVKMADNLVESETFFGRNGEIRRTVFHYTDFGALLMKVVQEHGMASCTYKAVHSGTKLTSDSTYDRQGKLESYRIYNSEHQDHFGNWIEQDFVIVTAGVPSPFDVQRFHTTRRIIYY